MKIGLGKEKGRDTSIELARQEKMVEEKIEKDQNFSVRD